MHLSSEIALQREILFIFPKLMDPLSISVNNTLFHKCLFLFPELDISLILIIVLIKVHPFIFDCFFHGYAEFSLRLTLMNLVINLEMEVCHNALKFLVSICHVNLPLRNITLMSLCCLDLFSV